MSCQNLVKEFMCNLIVKIFKGSIEHKIIKQMLEFVWNINDNSLYLIELLGNVFPLSINISNLNWKIKGLGIRLGN